ncbi:hypothetical protein NK6_6360 [Bradyrhizobium diazoefficiens]|uniref:Uncharacterized protein n=1 Tax=Bradyrhizobium diazoefficiens TaxID=1355477 RepID=A0A0E4BTC7_9BRAD|nr:hypothetical protein NK6_6360 [Bradyrhizobium diazoefficiens]
MSLSGRVARGASCGWTMAAVRREGNRRKPLFPRDLSRE